MKLSKPLLLLSLSLLISTKFIRAQEDEDIDEEEEIIEEELEQEVLDDVISENAEVSEEIQKEIASGIVDTSNYPGRIISRKKVVSKVPAAGQALEFEYTIWNVGNSDVTDIELVDDSFTSDNYETVKRIDIKKDVIKPGQSYSETHSVIPKMNEEAKLKLQPARVTYKTKTSNDNDELLQYTSDGATDGLVPLQTAAFYARHVANHYMDWVIFLVMAFPFTILPFNQGNALVARYAGKVKSA